MFLLVSLDFVSWCITIVPYQARFVKSCVVCVRQNPNFVLSSGGCIGVQRLLWGRGIKPPDPPKYHRGSPTRQPTLEATLCQLLRSPAGRVFSLAGEASGARPFCPDSVQERGCLSPFRQCHSSHSTNCSRKYPLTLCKLCLRSLTSLP